MSFLTNYPDTERCGVVVNTPVLYSGSLGFKPQPSGRLS